MVFPSLLTPLELSCGAFKFLVYIPVLLFLCYLFVYFKSHFIYFWLHWGLCCVRAFSGCSKQGLLFVAVHRLLIAVASLVAEHRLWVRELQQLWHTGLVALWHVESSWIRDRTHVPCTGRWILIHCATREVHLFYYF